MNILFKNIPIGINNHDLAKFIESEFNGRVTKGKKLAVTICCIEMMERQDHYSRPVEQFGIVRISPPDLAKKVIKQLDGCLFNKLKLTVREYLIRSTANDPRSSHLDIPDVILEKRVSDRREHSLIYTRQV